METLKTFTGSSLMRPQVIRTLLCINQTMLRQGLKGLLEKEPGLHLIGETATAREALRYALETRPDVMVMALKSPSAEELRAIHAIFEDYPEAKLIMLISDGSSQEMVKVFETIKP